MSVVTEFDDMVKICGFFSDLGDCFQERFLVWVGRF